MKQTMLRNKEIIRVLFFFLFFCQIGHFRNNSYIYRLVKKLSGKCFARKIKKKKKIAGIIGNIAAILGMIANIL